jgi:hypothetical protein
MHVTGGELIAILTLLFAALSAGLPVWWRWHDQRPQIEISALSAGFFYLHNGTERSVTGVKLWLVLYRPTDGEVLELVTYGGQSHLHPGTRERVTIEYGSMVSAFRAALMKSPHGVAAAVALLHHGRPISIRGPRDRLCSPEGRLLEMFTQPASPSNHGLLRPVDALRPSSKAIRAKLRSYP